MEGSIARPLGHFQTDVKTCGNFFRFLYADEYIAEQGDRRIWGLYRYIGLDVLAQVALPVFIVNWPHQIIFQHPG